MVLSRPNYVGSFRGAHPPSSERGWRARALWVLECGILEIPHLKWHPCFFFWGGVNFLNCFELKKIWFQHLQIIYVKKRGPSFAIFWIKTFLAGFYKHVCRHTAGSQNIKLFWIIPTGFKQYFAWPKKSLFFKVSKIWQNIPNFLCFPLYYLSVAKFG